MTLLFIAVSMMLLGSVLGSAATIFLWFRFMHNPENARNYLADVYKIAHPHWLQTSAAEDAARMCPVCGWTEPVTPQDDSNHDSHGKCCEDEKPVVRT